MSPVRTTYLPPWQPPPFRPSRSRGPIPRGTGPTEGGDSDRVGTVTVVVAPPGAVAPGASVTLTAVRTGGSAPLSYQWYDPTDTPIPGATGNSYTFTATTSGTYKVVVDSPGAVDAPLAATVVVVVTPPAGAPWTPVDISPFAWYDAADTSTITLDTGNVSEWRDKSGNSNVGVQPTYAKQPVYSATEQHGKPGIMFPARSQWLNLASAGTLPAADTTTKFDFYAAIRPSATGGSTVECQAIIARMPAGDGAGSWFIGIVHPGRLAVTLFTNGVDTQGMISSPASSYTTGQNIIASYHYDGTQASALARTTIRQDTVVQVLSSLTTYTGWGVQLRIGSSYTLEQNLSYGGGLFESVVTPALSAADREKMEGYLAHKWGLTANLPANHPYKAAPPTK